MQLFPVDEPRVVAVEAEEDAVPVLGSAGAGAGIRQLWSVGEDQVQRGTHHAARPDKLTWMYRYNPSNSVKLMLPLRSVSKMSTVSERCGRLQGQVTHSSAGGQHLPRDSFARATTHHFHAVLPRFNRLVLG